MGKKSLQITFIASFKESLETCYKTSSNHSLRHRCKIVLLYSEGYSVKNIASIMDTNTMSVYKWLKRFQTSGILGLHTKTGQGRPPILQQEHLEIVRAAVEQERQRLSQARQIVEENIGKKMSNETLTRFLKVITAVTNV